MSDSEEGNKQKQEKEKAMKEKRKKKKKKKKTSYSKGASGVQDGRRGCAVIIKLFFDLSP